MKDGKAARKTLDDLIKAYPKSEAIGGGQGAAGRQSSDEPRLPGRRRWGIAGFPLTGRRLGWGFGSHGVHDVSTLTPALPLPRGGPAFASGRTGPRQPLLKIPSR